MDRSDLTTTLSSLDTAGEPQIIILKQASSGGRRVGVFASSFNPPTVAHLEIVRRAEQRYTLDEIIALAGIDNADKTSYDCPIEDRVAMTIEAFKTESKVSIGVSSHPFYVDMVEAMNRLYPPATELHFIIGFDTFERVLDVEGQYTKRYHHSFEGRREALEYLLSRSRLIVANRGVSGRVAIRELLDEEPLTVRERILFLECPAELAEQSSSRVRENIHSNIPLSGLVPASVEQYIIANHLYR